MDAKVLTGSRSPEDAADKVGDGFRKLLKDYK